MFKGIKAVIFDMDGTLIDSMGVWAEIDRVFLKKRQIPMPDDILKNIEGMSFTETAHYFKNRFNLIENVEEITKEWIEMSKEYYRDHIPLKKGAKELVEKLFNNGFKIGLGTSCQQQLVQASLQKHGLESYFQSVRTSCEVGRGKPFPDIFLKVAEDLQVKPEECLVFEDTIAGIKAARQAGMRVIAVFDNHSLPHMDRISELSDGFIVNFKGIA